MQNTKDLVCLNALVQEVARVESRVQKNYSVQRMKKADVVSIRFMYFQHIFVRGHVFPCLRVNLRTAGLSISEMLRFLEAESESKTSP